MSKKTIKALDAISKNGVTAPELLNAIRNDSGLSYQDRVPAATQENLRTVGKAITEFPATTEQFLSVLINKVGLQLIANKHNYENPLSEFKMEGLQHGNIIEEMHANLIKGDSFNKNAGATEIFGKYNPDVAAMYHQQNRQDIYKLTISEDMLKSAFNSENGMQSLIDVIVAQLYNSDQYDEFLITKQVLAEKYSEGKMYKAPVAKAVDKATIQDLLVEIKTYAEIIKTPSKAYNAAGRDQWVSKAEDVVIFVTPRTKAIMDVKAFADVFNVSYAEAKNRIVVLDSFPEGMEDVQALLVDKNYLVIADTNFKVKSSDNPVSLENNFFLHHWQVISASDFQTAIAFVVEEKEVETPEVPEVPEVPETEGEEK